MRSCVHERRVRRRSRSCPVNLCELCGARRRRRAPPHQRPGEDVVNRCYLIINLDFIFRRLVGARVVAGRIRRPPLLPSDISRLPPHAQPRARDTANDVPPKSAPEVDVEEAGEPLVETQPY